MSAIQSQTNKTPHTPINLADEWLEEWIDGMICDKAKKQIGNCRI